MTVYTLGPNGNKDGPFAETHAYNQLDAREKVQRANDRRNWLDDKALYCMPIGPTATRLIGADEVRIFEKFEDLPPV